MSRFGRSECFEMRPFCVMLANGSVHRLLKVGREGRGRRSSNSCKEAKTGLRAEG